MGSRQKCQVLLTSRSQCYDFDNGAVFDLSFSVVTGKNRLLIELHDHRPTLKSQLREQLADTHGT